VKHVPVEGAPRSGIPLAAAQIRFLPPGRIGLLLLRPAYRQCRLSVLRDFGIRDSEQLAFQNFGIAHVPDFPVPDFVRKREFGDSLGSLISPPSHVGRGNSGAVRY